MFHLRFVPVLMFIEGSCGLYCENVYKLDTLSLMGHVLTILGILCF